MYQLPWSWSISSINLNTQVHFTTLHLRVSYSSIIIKKYIYSMSVDCGPSSYNLVLDIPEDKYQPTEVA